MKDRNSPAIIRRRVKDNFTHLPNDVIKDPRLSFKGLGLLTYILHLPDDFRLNLKFLAGQKKDGRDSTRAGLQELVLAGYLTIIQERDDSGLFSGSIWEVTDQPIGGIPRREKVNTGRMKRPRAENPNTAIPNSGSPDSINPTLLSTNKEQVLKVTTTTPCSQTNISSGSGLVWPLFFQGEIRESAEEVISDCPEEHLQEVLYELAGIADAGGIRTSAIGLLKVLVNRAKNGQFFPSAALVYRRKHESDAIEYQSRKEEREFRAAQSTPDAREKSKNHLNAVRELLKGEQKLRKVNGDSGEATARYKHARSM